MVSSDSDFTRLATRLRESGKTVYGVGAQKTPRAFRDACDKFTFLEVLRADAADPGDSTPEATAAPEPERSPDLGALQSLLVKALNKTASDDEDWSSLGALGSHLNRTDPSFDARTYGFARLSDLVKEQPYLEDKTVASGTGHGQLWVRIKRRKGAAKKATVQGVRREGVEREGRRGGARRGAGRRGAGGEGADPADDQADEGRKSS